MPLEAAVGRAALPEVAVVVEEELQRRAREGSSQQRLRCSRARAPHRVDLGVVVVPVVVVPVVAVPVEVVITRAEVISLTEA